MSEYQKIKLIVLRELLWERGIVPMRWMLGFITKDEACWLLEQGEKGRKVTEKTKLARLLRERQKQHAEKMMKAHKDRAVQFGTTKLTPDERLQAAINQHSPLTFVGMKEFEEPFQSATGSRRAKCAVVFADKDGGEFLLSKGEAEKAKMFGVPVPFHVFQPARKRIVAKTQTPKPLSDYFK